MYKIIDSNHCDNKYISAKLDDSVAHFIVGIDEIVYLNKKDLPLIMDDNNSQNYLSFSETENHSSSKKSLIFEYNKPYIDFIVSIHGYGASQKYFFKGTNRALYLNEPLTIDERYAFENREIEILNREEIEERFNKDNYDAMYIVDTYGKVLFANNKVNGLVVGDKIIPSDDEIVKWDLDNRIADFNIMRLITNSARNEERFKIAHTPRTIDEIQNFKLYGGSILRTYSHMLLTVKNGKFSLKWFRIDFEEKDKFKLTTSPISVNEPTVDDIINYTREDDKRREEIENSSIYIKNSDINQKSKRKWFKNI